MTHFVCHSVAQNLPLGPIAGSGKAFNVVVENIGHATRLAFLHGKEKPNVPSSGSMRLAMTRESILREKSAGPSGSRHSAKL
jgi:hypothetical protein